MSRHSSTAERAWPGFCARVLLAVVGGYLFTYAATAALARLLPLPRYDATIAATLASFVLYLIFILWVFATASLRRIGLALAAALPMAAIGFWPQLLAGLR